MDNSKPSINLYDFNKTNMAQIKPYDPIVLARMCNKTAHDIWDRVQRPVYWMLLCRERNDYTIFCIKNQVSEFSSALVECLNNRGKVLDITEQDDGNYEIWVRDFDTNENVAYYLFDYQNGVVEV